MSFATLPVHTLDSPSICNSFSQKQAIKNTDSRVENIRAQFITRPNFSEEGKLPVKMRPRPSASDPEAFKIIQMMDQKFKGKFSLFLSHQLLPTVGLIFNHEKLIDCLDCFARILVRRIMIRNNQSSARSATWHMRWALFFGHLTVNQYNFFRSNAPKESVLKFGRNFMEDFQNYVCQNHNSLSQIERIKNQHIYEMIEMIEYLLELLEDPNKHPFLLKPLRSCIVIDSKVINEIKQNAHKKFSEALDIYSEGFSAEFTQLLNVSSHLPKDERQREESLELIQKFREGLENLTPFLHTHLQKFYKGYAEQFMWVRTASLQIIQKNTFLIHHLQYVRNTELFFQNYLYFMVLMEKYQTTTFKKEPLELFNDTVEDFQSLIAHFLNRENFKQFEPKQEEGLDPEIEKFLRDVFLLMYEKPSRLLLEMDQEWRKSDTLDRLKMHLDSLSLDFDFSQAIACIKIFEEELFFNSDEIFFSYIENYLLLYSKLNPLLKEAPNDLLIIKIQKNLEQMSFWVSSLIECVRTLKKVYYAMFHLEETVSKTEEKKLKNKRKQPIKNKRNNRRNMAALRLSSNREAFVDPVENEEKNRIASTSEPSIRANKNFPFIEQDKKKQETKVEGSEPLPLIKSKEKGLSEVRHPGKTRKVEIKEIKENSSKTQMPEFSRELLKWKKMVKLAQKYAGMTLKPGGKHAHLVATDPLPGDAELPLPISSRDLAKGTAHKIYDQIKSRFQRLLKNEDL
ncbi:MAG: hypothetical protein J0H93_01045 [Chlamydiales bacterium]|nr:hypothetical protein [Chlamydiales bacterium]